MRILHSGTPSQQLTQLNRLLAAAGLDVDMVDVAGESMSREAIADLGSGGLVLDSASLGKVTGAADSVRDFIATGTSVSILLFATDAEYDTSRFLKTATDGAVEGTSQASGETVRFTDTTVPAARVVAGTCFPRNAKPALRLVGNGIRATLQIDDGTVFGLVENTSAPMLFVWSTFAVFDVSRRLSSELEFELAVDEHIPGIVFARSAGGASTWQNPNPGASLIIDDPLLQPRYGHIDFQQLLDSARNHRYTVTLAFIPWNHWRTKKRNAALFRQYSDVFSVCVHGNDHTAAEFESGSYDELRNRAEQAIERMDKHRDRTGINYAAVMVCPQERYSVEALRAIAASGRYRAVANTRLIPNVPEAVGQITGADLLQPAMDVWSPSALLKRHYPTEGIGKLALNVFLGRPLVLAEHHGYFSAGTERIEAVVQELRRRCPELTWQPLEQMVQTLRWQRQMDDQSWEIRFFTDDFRLEPASVGPATYQLERRVQPSSAVKAVSVDGREIDFNADGSRIRIQVRASAPVAVQITRRDTDTNRVPGVSPIHHTSVALRRWLSEFRDRTSASCERGMTLVQSLLPGKAQATGDRHDS